MIINFCKFVRSISSLSSYPLVEYCVSPIAIGIGSPPKKTRKDEKIVQSPESSCVCEKDYKYKYTKLAFTQLKKCWISHL